MTTDASLTTHLPNLIARYKGDSESVYNTWFAGSKARMKGFRSIRRGVQNVVSSIAEGTFGNDFKGSPLGAACSKTLPSYRVVPREGSREESKGALL